MIRHLLQRLLGSVTGKHYNKHGHHGHNGHNGHYSHSSSDYKKGNYYPPKQPPYGHSHYKKKYGSYSS
ncbi:hypothetical protein [Paenibacillus sp. JDR-2]|uniref:hypothetical protein n=1 Tax=Paenibacillus sp. (strain JDR-2) TaxID=324057 RepID=UPI000166B07B|nr:hypothetical protein [Paenibacillus sp. JDR-2]ACS99133.1 hypothetical protein Pjdr2_0453 [Paenibacillus sp. JDR-2]